MNMLVERWRKRREKYPWILTIGTLLLFFSFNLVSLILNSRGIILQEAYNFCYNNLFSLILWIGVAFFSGFLKNQNLSWEEEFTGGTLSRSVFYGIALYFGVALIFIALAIFNQIIFSLDVPFTTSDTRLEIPVLIISASFLGCFTSITLRGSLYPEFLSLEK